MKVPAFINEQVYERELNKLVRKLEEKIKVIETRGFHDPDSNMGRLYITFRRSKTPLTAREGAQRAKWDMSDQMRYRVAVQRLQEGGWLIPVDKVERSWSVFGKTTLTALVMRFKAVKHNPHRAWRIERAVDEFLRRVEKLDEKRVHGICITAIYESDTVRDTRRDRMFQLKLGGKTLQQIGDGYGITRERVRQILEKTIERKLEI